MTGHNTIRPSHRRGVLRLVLLMLTMAGFVAMHGLTSASAGEAHCGSPAALLLTSDAHPPAGPAAAHHDDPLGEHGIHASGEPAPSHSSDPLMVGCLLALLVTLVAIGLRLLGRPGAVIISAAVRQALAWLRTARGPPDPLFLSLCVFRL